MWASTNSITDSQTSLTLCSHSGWPQKPANGLEAFSPPTILCKDPAHPSPSDISVWTPSKHLPTTLEDCTEESRQDTDSNSVMVFCQNRKAGKSSLHVQCKRDKFSRWQWPCTLPTPKQISFSSLLQLLKQQRKLAGKTGNTHDHHFPDSWSACFPTKPRNSLTKRFSNT